MTEETLAKIEGPSQRIKSAVEQAALAGKGDPFHSDVYLNIRDGIVNTLVGSPGNVVLSYCTFSESYFDGIDVETDEPLAGTDDDGRDSVEAIINVADFMSYLDFASDGGTVRLSFRGQPGDRLATALEMTGALNTRVMLPSSESILDEIPTGLPNKFDPDENFTGSPEDSRAEIVTDTSQIQDIIEVVDYDPEIEFYPITVEDGELVLNVGSEDAPDRNSVWGSLDAKSLDVPVDFDNQYHEGFEPVFNTLSGEVRMQTNPDSPVVVVQEDSGRVARHMLGNMGE